MEQSQSGSASASESQFKHKDSDKLDFEGRAEYNSRDGEGSNNRLVPQQNNMMDDELVDELQESDYNLTFPQGVWNRVAYVVFFPVNLLMYFIMPNFRKDSRMNKTLAALVLTLIILGGMSFLIVWWVEEIAFGISAEAEMLGSCFASIGFALPFVVYNLRLFNERKEEHNYYNVFRQIGIFRIGLCVSISWLITGAIGGSNAEVVGFGGSAVSYYILTALVMIEMVFVIVEKCKLTGRFYRVYFVSFFIWWVCCFVLNEFFAEF